MIKQAINIAIGQESTGDSSAQAIINEMETVGSSVPAEWQTSISNLVGNLKSGLIHSTDVWTELDEFWVLAVDSEAHATVPWKNPTGTKLSPTSSPTFTAKQGYAGDGTADFVDTGWTPATDGVNYTLNNASIHCYITTYTDGNMNCGTRGTDGNGDTWIRNVDMHVNEMSHGGGADRAALYSNILHNGTIMETYRDGTFITSGLTPAPTGPSDSSIYILGVNDGGSLLLPTANQIGFLALGSDMNAAANSNMVVDLDAAWDQFLIDINLGAFNISVQAVGSSVANDLIVATAASETQLPDTNGLEFDFDPMISGMVTADTSLSQTTVKFITDASANQYVLESPKSGGNYIKSEQPVWDSGVLEIEPDGENDQLTGSIGAFSTDLCSIYTTARSPAVSGLDVLFALYTSGNQANAHINGLVVGWEDNKMTAWYGNGADSEMIQEPTAGSYTDNTKIAFNSDGSVRNLIVDGTIVASGVADYSVNVDTLSWFSANNVFSKAISRTLFGYSASKNSSEITTLLNHIDSRHLAEDTTDPSVSNATLSFSNITPTAITVDFTKATDDTTLQSNLVYKLYRASDGTDISNLTNIDANGMLIDTQTDVAQFTDSGLSPSTPYEYNITVEDEAGNRTPYTQNNQSTSADVTAPTLTSPTATADGNATASGSVNTDEDNGILYWVITQSATTPSAAQIKSGQDHTGSAADVSGNQSITSTGSKTFITNGLTAGTTYHAHYMHEDAENNQSTPVSSTSFTTTSGTDPSAQAVIDEMNLDGAAVDSAHQTATNNFILNLKTGLTNGTYVWSKIQRLDVFAVQEVNHAWIDWKDPSNSVKGVPSTSPAPTFVIDEGISGGDSGAYVNVNWVPNDNGVTINDGGMSCYVRNFVLSTGFLMRDTTSNLRFHSTLHQCMEANTDEFNESADTGSNTLTTRGSGNPQLYINGSLDTTSPETPSEAPTGTIQYLSSNGSFGNGAQIAMGVWHTELTTNEIVDLHDAMEAYMDELGTGVVV